MTREPIGNELKFFLTQESACPYLPGQRERKVFTLLDRHSGPALADELTHYGFRRSQNIAYRPACDHCDACLPARVPAATFRPGKTQRRILRANEDLHAAIVEPRATTEQYRLLHRYLAARHPGGGMNDMALQDYAQMVESQGGRTFIVEYRLRDDPRGELLAAALIDILADGVSLIYSFYEPDAPKRSLGGFIILNHIERLRRASERNQDQPLRHVYLGYFVAQSAKMSYKANFKPLEFLLPGRGWVRVEDPAEFDAEAEIRKAFEALAQRVRPEFRGRILELPGGAWETPGKGGWWRG